MDLHTPQSVFAILGNIFGLFLFLSPLTTFIRIVRKRSTENVSPMLHVVTFTNCLLSGLYALPLVSRNNEMALCINAIGALISCTYLITFIVLSSDEDRVKMRVSCYRMVVILASYVSICLLILHGNIRKFVCGTVAVVFSTIMYASHFMIIAQRYMIKREVELKTDVGLIQLLPMSESAGVVPLLLISAFLYGTTWLCFGLINDYFVACSNALGCGLGASLLLVAPILKERQIQEEELLQVHQSERKIIVA